MLSFFVKKGKKNQMDNFPSAEDALKRTKQKWKSVSLFDIRSRIEFEISRGQRQATFWEAIISSENKELLERKGYIVNEGTEPCSDAPYFKVNW